MELYAVLSWLHDEAVALDVEYGDETATIEVTARPAVIERAESRVERLPT